MGFDANSKVDLFMVIEPPTDREPETVSKSRPVVAGLSDADRIASAKCQIVERSKASNAPGNFYGFHYGPKHFQDSDGPETSMHHFELVVFLLQLLAAAPAPHATLAEMKAKLEGRIRELGLSEPLIWEWLAEPLSPTDDRAFWQKSFDERIAQFKQS